MILNHYRSTESAIKEIENCTFHFATREELNDPIEGYVRVFWQGDRAAWEGLFRNYICSLSQAMTLYLLKGDEDILRHKSLVVDLHRFDAMPLGAILMELGDRFLREEIVTQLATICGENRLKVCSEELLLYLTYIHSVALVLCLQSHQQHNTMPETEAEAMIQAFSSIKKASFPDELIQWLSKPSLRESISKVGTDTLEDMLELHYIRQGFSDDSFLYGLRKDKHGNTVIASEITRARQHRNWLTVVTDFPRVYVNQLKDMIYPESYVVCFSGKNDNSAMWGNYADNHQGVCLVYETDTDGKLTVKGEDTYTGEVKPVSYEGEIIERNFFESFGRLTVSQIRTWLTGTEGLSSAYKAFRNKAEWRDRYWAAFEAKTYRKLGAWQYENEYRFALANTFYTFNEPSSRNLRYNPKNLKGVIFGIKTSEYDKKRIVEKLMIHADEYDGFTFYQAEYDEVKQRIRIRKKGLWDMRRWRVTNV